MKLARTTLVPLLAADAAAGLAGAVIFVGSLLLADAGFDAPSLLLVSAIAFGLVFAIALPTSLLIAWPVSQTFFSPIASRWWACSLFGAGAAIVVATLITGPPQLKVPEIDPAAISLRPLTLYFGATAENWLAAGRFVLTFELPVGAAAGLAFYWTRQRQVRSRAPSERTGSEPPL